MASTSFTPATVDDDEGGNNYDKNHDNEAGDWQYPRPFVFPHLEKVILRMTRQ